MLRVLAELGEHHAHAGRVVLHAHHLAHALAFTPIDLDDITPTLLGPGSLREVWDRVGQEAFRLAETKALTTTLERPKIVLALGGGTPTAPGADEVLRTAASAGDRIIYLRTSPQVLRDRLEAADNTDRPALMGTDALTEIETVHNARDPLYRTLATEVIECDDLSVEQTTKLILSGDTCS